MIKRIGVVVCSALLVAGCSDSSGSDPLVLEDLLGTNTLQWRFSDTLTEFAAEVTYTEQSILPDEDGNLALAGMARTFSREDMSSEFVSHGENVIICAPLPDGSLNLCIITENSGAVSAFLFGGLVNGQAEGNFEFCDVGELVNICVEENLSPTLADGPMFISNTPVPVVVPEIGSIERDSDYATDTMRYLEQGTTYTDTSDGRVDFKEVHVDSIVEAVIAFTTLTNLSTLAE